MLSISQNSCCNNYQSISDFLVKDLLGNSMEQVILERYDRMINCCNDGHQHQDWAQQKGKVLQTKKDVLLEVPIGNNTSLSSQLSNYGTVNNVGHDLPYWIAAEEEKNKVMLVSQDPLRNNQQDGSITISSPFGMHSIDYRGNRLMTQLVGGLLRNGISVYLTDFHKLYATQNNKAVNFKGLDSTFKEILEKEIKEFNPSMIIPVGKLAENAIANMSPGGTIVPIPHPNARGIKWKDCVNSKLGVKVGVTDLFLK